ncbi:MAG: pilus assembly PilX N-terminal domain-containing protein [Dehalococcoidia bacterium]|nr:pilus assembly PilX N-terminal domain-containing protein [Dehalococcoidia bacterium]
MGVVKMDNMAKNKKGYVLTMALVIMTVGAIIIVALLNHLNTSLLLSSKSEERAITYYAADSGFEYAFFFLQQGKELTGWNETEEQQWEREPYVIYDRTVAVSVVEDTGNQTYKITSTATADSGSSTIIESYVFEQTFDLSPFGDNAITSNGDVTILGQEGGIEGNVTYSGTLNCPGDPDCAETINGTVTQDPDGIDWWMSTGECIDYFLSQVDASDPYLNPSIDANSISNIGPLYRQGDQGDLDIYSSQDGKTLTLNGTVYVTGDLDIGNHAKEFTLDLNDQTIFVEGCLTIGGATTIEGSGCLIAIGDIFFSPNIASGEDDFLFTMSIEGFTTLNPGSTYYGSIAGNAEVTLQPGIQLEWIAPDSVDFELPSGEPQQEILTYDIK